MGLFKKKDKQSQPQSQSHPQSQQLPPQQEHQQAGSHYQSPSRHPQSASARGAASPSSSHPSKTTLSLHGLPLTVYGLSELTPSSSRASSPPPPEVCLVVHMHGRGGSAESEEWICQGLWRSAMQEKEDYLGTSNGSTQAAGGGSAARRGREVLVVGFDARNHGHRLTDELAQKGWGVGNEQHAIDLYGMILGTAADVSHIISFLPSYLFPHDDRLITVNCVTGKSLGGHAVWHVLKDDPRVTIGVSMIGMPDYERLLEFRTKQSFKTNGPPTVPASLKKLVRLRDPPYCGYDRWGEGNPYWGKKVLALSGAQDKLVHPSFSQPFLSRLAISHPEGRTGEQVGLKVRWLDGVKHEVTEEMVREAGQWIGKWGLLG